MQINTNEEIKSLTGIRGVAALFVALHHFYGYYNLHGSKTGVFGNSWFFTFFLHGYLAVDVFFILSAFVITLSSGKYFASKFNFSNYKLFMQKRWIRVYPAYFFIVVFGYIFILHFHRSANFILSLTLLNILFNLAYLFGHLWSLGAEWVAYLIYPLLYKYANLAKAKLWNYVVIATGFAVLIAIGLKWSKESGYHIQLELFQGMPAFFRCIGDYLIGLGAFYIYKNKRINILTSNLTASLLSLLVIASLFVINADIVSIFICMFLILSISKDDNLIAKFLASKPVYFLGIISYPLYLIHFIISEKLNVLQAFLAAHLSFGSSYYALFAVYIILALGISTLFTYYIELPTIKWLKKRLFKKPAKPPIPLVNYN